MGGEGRYLSRKSISTGVTPKNKRRYIFQKTIENSFVDCAIGLVANEVHRLYDTHFPIRLSISYWVPYSAK